MNNTLIDLQDRLDTLQDENISLKSECSDYRQTIASFVDVKASYDEQIRKLSELHNSQLVQLQQDLSKEKQSVNRRVNAQLASVGVKQFAVEEIEPTPVAPEEILKQFNAMPSGIDKQNFYATNKAVLNKCINLENTPV